MMFAVFLSGVAMAAFAAAGLFFMKIWRASGDRFFHQFGIACWLISIERIVGLFFHETLEPVRDSLQGMATWIYLIRLLAFGLIIMAVVRKNRSDGKPAYR